jgi:hypothetical protein
MGFMFTPMKKIKFEKPELVKINLLDESALGDTGFGNEPPPPASEGVPMGGMGSIRPENTDKWKSRHW